MTLRLEVKPIATLVVAHGFFGDGPCPALDLVPLPESAQKLTAHGLRILASPGQIQIYADVTKGPFPLSALGGLGFWLRSRDEAMADYSDPPFVSGQLLVLSTEGGDPRSLPVAGRELVVPNSRRLRGAEVVIHRLKDNAEVLRHPVADKTRVVVPLGDLAEGAYVMRARGLPALPFAHMRHGSSGTFGMIEIDGTDLGTVDAPATLGAGIAAPLRQWGWRVSAPHDLSDWRLRLTSGGAEIAPQDLGDGQWRFALPDAVPVRAHAADRFQLVPPAGAFVATPIDVPGGEVAGRLPPGSDIWVTL